MDLRKLKKLIELLEESALSEMEISEGENTIRLSRAPRMAPGAYMPGPPVTLETPATASTPAVDSPATESPAQTSPSPSAEAKDAPAGHAVVSPLVGTFYDSPSPDASPFVTVGQTVARGDTLCLIEAMKTFNHIDAEVAGTVSAVHKHNGEPVEYGETLFVIDGGGGGD